MSMLFEWLLVLKVFIVFSDTYINLAKYLQRVSLEVTINWHNLHQDEGKTYQISNMRSTGSIKSNPLQAYEKEYWRLSAYKKRH